MYWTFDNEGIPRMSKKEEAACEVKIKGSESGSEVNIEQKDCYDAHKTLGAMENPSGNYKQEVKRLVEKARSIAHKNSMATVNRKEAHIIDRSMYIPSINYSFPTGILVLKKQRKSRAHRSKHYYQRWGITHAWQEKSFLARKKAED